MDTRFAGLVMHAVHIAIYIQHKRIVFKEPRYGRNSLGRKRVRMTRFLIMHAQ